MCLACRCHTFKFGVITTSQMGKQMQMLEGICFGHPHLPVLSCPSGGPTPCFPLWSERGFELGDVQRVPLSWVSQGRLLLTRLNLGALFPVPRRLFCLLAAICPSLTLPLGFLQFLVPATTHLC